MEAQIEREATHFAPQAAALAAARNYTPLTPNEYGKAVGMSQAELVRMERFSSDDFKGHWMPLTSALLRDELTNAGNSPLTRRAFMRQVLKPGFMLGVDYRIAPGNAYEITGDAYLRLLMRTDSAMGHVMRACWLKIPSVLGFGLAYEQICDQRRPSAVSQP